MMLPVKIANTEKREVYDKLRSLPAAHVYTTSKVDMEAPFHRDCPLFEQRSPPEKSLARVHDSVLGKGSPGTSTACRETNVRHGPKSPYRLPDISEVSFQPFRVN